MVVLGGEGGGGGGGGVEVSKLYCTIEGDI